MAELKVIEIARRANAFRREHWRKAAGPLGIVVVGSTLDALLGPASAVAGAVAALVQAGAAAMAYAGLARLALTDRHPGDPAFVPAPSGFQWRQAEWLVVGFSLVVIAVVFLFALAGAVVAETLASRGTGPAKAGAVLALALEFCAVFYGLMRLAPGAVASVDRGRLAVGATWRITRGRVIPILGANVLVVAVTIGMTLVAIIAGAALGALIAVLTPATSGEALGAALGAFGAAAVAAFVGLPLSVGVSSHVYRTLAAAPGAEASP